MCYNVWNRIFAALVVAMMMVMATARPLFLSWYSVISLVYLVY